MYTTTIRVLGCAILLACAGTTLAASKSKSRSKSEEVAYRCRNAAGESFFGQAIPAECMNLDIEVLDSGGRVVRRIDGTTSLIARSAAEERQKAQEQQQQLDSVRDRTLLATYLSVSDIERLRDQRLELLEQQSQTTRQYIVQLHERETRLMEDVQRFRPYSASEKAPALPDHVAEDIVNTVNGLQVYEQQLAKNTVEQGRLRESFDRDIGRFKQLKGL